MSDKIVCLHALLRGGCGDWDTFHLRMSVARIAQYPLYDEQHHKTDEILAVWTDEEYEQKWGHRFVDAPAPPWESDPKERCWRVRGFWHDSEGESQHGLGALLIRARTPQEADQRAHDALWDGGLTSAGCSWSAKVEPAQWYLVDQDNEPVGDHGYESYDEAAQAAGPNQYPRSDDCQHPVHEDCMICASCGRCRESLDEGEICADCQAGGTR